MITVEIPLRPATPMRFSMTLAGVAYTARIYWNVFMQCWSLELADVDGYPLIMGIPLVTGTDLLGQFGYVDIGGQLLVTTTPGPPDTVPGWADMGVTGHIYFVVLP